MRYDNPAEAIDWLCSALGFEKHSVYASPDGSVMHAELTFRGGMIMLGAITDNEYSKLMKQPGEIGGAETRSVAIIVPDADVVCDRVKAPGGEMIFDIEDKPYGGRAFTCRDPQGHTWDVGTYDPWAPK